MGAQRINTFVIIAAAMVTRTLKLDRYTLTTDLELKSEIAGNAVLATKDRNKKHYRQLIMALRKQAATMRTASSTHYPNTLNDLYKILVYNG